MPSREENYRIASQIVDNSIRQLSDGVESAWIGIYEALLWYETMPDGEAFPHIIDANRVRRANTKNIWRQRSRAFEAYLAERMGVGHDAVKDRVDQLMRHPEFLGLQRQNPLGIAFIGVVQHLMRRYGSRQITYRTEFSATELFPTISLAGRSESPQIDIAAFKDGRPVAIISNKWSLRHDRLGDLVAECRAYKAAAMWTQSIQYHVITNEFDPARLIKALSDECFDSVTHVHSQAVIEVCQLDGGLAGLSDLTKLIEKTQSW